MKSGDSALFSCKSLCKLANRGAVLLLFGASLNAHAQTQNEDAEASKGGVVLEEIVVYAERREERWQDVPIAVTTMSGETIETLAIRDIRDLSDFVPAYTVRSFNIDTPEVFIRGVGSQTLDHVTDELSVGFFLDDVYLARGAAQKIALYDVERLEVLRGPQGTLFGRNTIGGLVQVITNQPKDEFEADLSLSAGDYNLLRAQGMVNIPLVQDRLFARLVAAYESHDGYQENIFDQARFDQQVALDPRITTDDLALGYDGYEADDYAWRLKIRGIITDNFEVTLAADAEQRREGALLTGQFVRQPESMQWETLAPPPELTDYTQFIYNGLGPVTPTRFQNRIWSPAIDAPSDLRTSYYGQPWPNEMDQTGISLHADLQLSNASLIFVGAARESETLVQEDLDASYGDYSNSKDTTTSDTSSLELRLQSNDEGSWSLDGRLDWTVGVYYFEEDVDKIMENPSKLTRRNSHGEQHVDTESLGIFGQFTYDLTERLALTLGYRWTDEDKSGLLTEYAVLPINIGDSVTYRSEAECVAAIVADPGLIGRTSIDLTEVVLGSSVLSWLTRDGGKCGGAPITPYENLPVESSDSKGTGKVALNYALTDETSAYVLFSQGFKSTAFNGGANNPTDAQTVYAPEALDLYEFGMKVRDDAGKFQVSAAMFYNDFTDFKQPKFSFDSNNPNQGISAGKADDAEIYGYEIDASVVLWDSLVLQFATTRLAARLQSYSALDGTKLDVLDIVRIPEASHYASGKYTLPETSFGDFAFRVDWVGESDSINMVPISDPSQSEGRTSPAFIAGNGGDRIVAWSKWDAQLEFVHSSQKWDASLWVRNVGDELYYTRSSVNFVDPEAVINAFWGEPRTYGITFNYQFGNL